MSGRVDVDPPDHVRYRPVGMLRPLARRLQPSASSALTTPNMRRVRIHSSIQRIRGEVDHRGEFTFSAANVLGPRHRRRGVVDRRGVRLVGPQHINTDDG